MNVSPIPAQQAFLPESNSTANSVVELIKKIYPDINNAYFSEKPNVFDMRYIAGSDRESAIFKNEEYINKKHALDDEIRQIYSDHQIDPACISPDEANSTEGSWKTVISGKRPMGQFSVDTLYSPELHAILELENIGCKIFPKENNAFLHIVVAYRKDSEKGELYATRFIELYDKKRKLMESMTGEDQVSKVIKSELIIAREMGTILSYSPEEIDGYMHKLNSSLS